MAINIISPTNSFIRFDEAENTALCIWGMVDFCLPVYEDEDVYFQFVIEGEVYDIDSLCTQTGDEVVVSLVNDCGGGSILTFSEKPDRFRLSATQVLYNWTHGLPGFTSVVSAGECFKIQIVVQAAPYGYPEDTDTYCSNCFERIASDCFTSVIEYGNDEDGFGFKYCYGGDLPGDNPTTLDCSPTIVSFVGVATLAIPYTALLEYKYGVLPTVQVWIYDGSGALVNMGITAGFDTYPPTMINLDFGGTASGIVIIR
jgi:hypothetical protein